MTVKEILRIIVRSVLGVISVICIIVLTYGNLIPVESGETVDRIDDYIITASVNDDGSVDMDYQITWSVISNAEGPLTWVKIGVPNSNFDNVKALSSNIKKAYYYYQDGEQFIRVDLDRPYHAGETLQIHYSFTQYNMYVEGSDMVVYDFAPGWFGKITVTHYAIRWSDKNVQSVSPYQIPIGGYYVWTGSLDAGQRTRVRISYSPGAYDFEEHSVFHLPPIKGLLEGEMGKELLMFIICFGGWVLYGITLGRDDYYRDDMYWGCYRGPSHGGGHGHFRGGGCACACACAGGGRAGCSAKDLYGTKLESQRVRARLRAAAGKK